MRNFFENEDSRQLISPSINHNPGYFLRIDRISESINQPLAMIFFCQHTAIQHRQGAKDVSM
jgi:hypothetical protein